MFKFAIGLAAVFALSAPAQAEDDRPCEELAIEMLAGEWEVDDVLIAGDGLYRVQMTWTGELIGPGQVKFETTPNSFRIVSHRRSGGTVQVVDAAGEPLAPTGNFMIPVCTKIPDAGTFYWIEEGWTGPDEEWEYRKESYVTQKLAVQNMWLKSPEQGADGEFALFQSTHMARPKRGLD